MRWVFVLGLVAALACAASPPAGASHKSKSCGVVAKGSRDYRVKTRRMKCKHARKWVRAFLKSRKRAPRFRCDDPPDRNIPFFCFYGQKAYWAVRL
jgi:hypothetical protein